MRAVLRFFFSPRRAKTRAIACASGQQFLFGHEIGEQLGLLRHGAEAAADVDLEAALPLPVHLSQRRHRADIVHVRQRAGLFAAARKGDLELAPEVLRVGMAEQEIRQRLGVRRDVEGLRLGTRPPAGRR